MISCNKRNILLFCLVILISIAVALTMRAFGWISFVTPDKSKTVFGIDVSHYQGNINWEKVKREEVVFAYIKATEGDFFTDPKFEDNLANANATGIIPGAYHFFHFDIDGALQAEYFIKNVPLSGHMLPPAVDVEFNGNSNLYDKNKVAAELIEYVEKIEKYYKKQPVIYVLYDTYEMFIRDRLDYPIWIRIRFLYLICMTAGIIHFGSIMTTVRLTVSRVL